MGFGASCCAATGGDMLKWRPARHTQGCEGAAFLATGRLPCPTNQELVCWFNVFRATPGESLAGSPQAFPQKIRLLAKGFLKIHVNQRKGKGVEVHTLYISLSACREWLPGEFWVQAP